MPRRRPAIPALAAIAVIALAGCAAQGAGDAEPDASEPAAPAPSTSASEPSDPAPSVAPSAEPTSPPEGIDTSGWLDHVAHDGLLTYRYPADWTLASDAYQAEHDPTGRWYDTSTLTAPTGQLLLEAGDTVDTGFVCPDGVYPIEILGSEPADVQPLEGHEVSQITTVALGTEDGRWRFGVGIASVDPLQDLEAPTCGFSFVHGSSDGNAWSGTHYLVPSHGDDPLWTVDTLDDARAYMETAEYATLLEILRSVRTP